MHPTDILLSLLWLPILLAAVLRLRVFALRGVRNAVISLLFCIKTAGAFALQWIYTYRYTNRTTGDIFRFFDDGIILHSIARTAPMDYLRIIFGTVSDSARFNKLYFSQMNAWNRPFESGFYNDTPFMIKLHSLLTFMSSGVFEAHNLVFTFAAFAGLVLLCKTFLTDGISRTTALVLTTLLPSSLLMVSGALKESVMVFGAGLLLWPALHGARLPKIPALTTAAGGLLFSVSVKPYFLAAALAALAAHWICRALKMRPWISWGVWGVGIVCAVLVLHFAGFDLIGHIAQKRNDFINHSTETQAGSAIALTPMDATWTEVLHETPTALANTLLRPWLWEVSGAPEVLMLLENLLILIIAATALFFMLKRKAESPLLTFALQCALPALVLVGLISPVLGATMRYRAPFLLLLIIAISPYLRPFWKKSTA